MSGVGHLGELDVINYLSKEKRQTIYLPLKDKGIDFISVGNNAFHQIQVKTSMFQKNSYFWFDLCMKKLVFSKNTYYVFVCKSLGRRQFMGKTANFLVVPSLKIEGWIRDGLIAEKENSPGTYNIFVYPDFERDAWLYKNKGKRIDLTKYWNNFDFIY